MFDAGDIDLLAAGLCGIGCVGGFARYHREPGPTAWLVLAGVSVVGWYAHPVVWLGFTPILVGYYLALAPRHGPAWHLGLAGMLVVGLVPNLWWLADWGRFWWLREQQALADGPRPPGPSAVFGEPADLAALLGPEPLGWPLVLAGLLGCLLMTRLKRRTSAWLFAVTILTAAAAARLGQLWPPVHALGLDRAAPFAVGLAVIPAAFVLAAWWDRARIGWLATVAVALVPAALAWAGDDDCRKAHLSLDPLRLGLTPGQDEWIHALVARTTADARILVEDPDASGPGWNWTALLPSMTGRAFLGGLDGGACVELVYCGLGRGRLNGRPLAEYSDDDLAEFCRLYNIGWVVAHGPAAARWKAWSKVTELARFDDGAGAVLLAIDRPKSYVLSGTATVAAADRRQIVLTDLVASPDGDVLLSFHHQPGLRVSPPTVVLGEARDPKDPTGFIRLRIVSGHGAARVVIRWDP
jgi:hypothetical protein